MRRPPKVEGNITDQKTKGLVELNILNALFPNSDPRMLAVRSLPSRQDRGKVSSRESEAAPEEITPDINTKGSPTEQPS